jgi:hypothetical protein
MQTYGLMAGRLVTVCRMAMNAPVVDPVDLKPD